MIILEYFRLISPPQPVGGGGGGVGGRRLLVSFVPLLKQSIAKHTLNSVLEILNVMLNKLRYHAHF